MTTVTSGGTSVTVDRSSNAVALSSYRRNVTVGVPGPQGPTGPPLNMLGAVASDAVLPQSGDVGDAFVSSDSGHMWVYGSNGWVDIGVIGGESQSYTHTQAVPSASWTVTHNLGRHPAIHVEDSVGNVVHGSIQHLSNNEAVVTFSSVVTGTAVCS